MNERCARRQGQLFDHKEKKKNWLPSATAVIQSPASVDRAQRAKVKSNNASHTVHARTVPIVFLVIVKIICGVD
ncbi:hypothetical protein RRG08_064558 [Elysia crispata]|uniref:Uncharacterized protein n=1 Tax=Elysia crispata TaxID=231223 RepID=A0AAE1B9N3_9GAST|nr:hypothetical protein RRG08_064558 [Elysia crispata]